MADKSIKVRIQNKSDTSANWDKATSFIPKEGELIFYTDLNKVKVGDGKTNVVALNFLHSATADSATKATQDANGNTISTTYAKFTDTLYTLPAATSSALGGVKIGYNQSDKNYPVQLDSSGKAYVNVPWANTTYSVATTSSPGLMSAVDKSKVDGLGTQATYSYSSGTLTITTK